MSLNTVVIMGRITKTPELKTTKSGKNVSNFCLAVERSYCADGQERQTDFIDCLAWGKTAEFLLKYFNKGDMIAITGELQTQNFEDKNGNKRKSTEVVVKELSFCGGKKENTNNIVNITKDDETIDFEEVDDLPF